MFALAIVPVVGAVGAAVDYIRANAVRADLQSSLDAVTLMLSKEALQLSPADLKTKANAYFNSLFHHPEMGGITLDPSFATNNNTFTVKVSAQGTLDTTVGHVLGISQMNIDASSEAEWSMHRIELALALDNTGSMAALNKMSELKKATKNLLQALQNTARTPDQIKVAIVPFDTVVNVGTGNVDAPWMRFNAGTSKAAWTGCVADRDQPNDVQDTAPAADPTLFPAAPCTGTGSLVKMQPLTNDWTQLRQTVDQMTPAGTTNVTIGLEWAWHALSPSVPLTEGAAPKSDLDKVLVLLTDGTNTQNRWTSNPGDIDARTQLACSNIKADGIKVYTVRVIEGNATLLRNCASAANMYFDVQDAPQLDAVFSQIGQMLANIRLSK
jgi:Mg-chelatase subunit ChlD